MTGGESEISCGRKSRHDSIEAGAPAEMIEITPARIAAAIRAVSPIFEEICDLSDFRSNHLASEAVGETVAAFRRR